MTKVRSRGGARVDYTDFLSPAAKALPKRGGGDKRKADEEDAEDAAEDEEDEELVAVKKKKKAVVKKPSKPKKLAEQSAEEEETVAKEKEAVKPKATKPKKATTTKRRTEEDDDERQLQRGKEAAEHERKPAKKAKRETEATAVVVSKARRYEEEVVVRTSSTAAAASSSAPLGDAAHEMAALRKKYDALREFRELETERLLKEAKALAKEEKRTYETLVKKLKDEVATLLTRAQRVDADNKKRHEELLVEHKQRVETLKHDRQDAVETNERLRRRIKELEAEAVSRPGSSSSSRAASITDASRAGDVSVELTQAKKLLELYRLVTSTELRLIEITDDEDDAGVDTCTDVECAVVDSVSGKRFVFDLAVPHDAMEEVEYVPSDKPARDFKTPSYLQEELSFKRSELTKFMRTVLDVVIRKKKTASEHAKR